MGRSVRYGTAAGQLFTFVAFRRILQVLRAFGMFHRDKLVQHTLPAICIFATNIRG